MNFDYYKDPPTLTRNFSTSAVESLKSFKENNGKHLYLKTSSEDNKQLKSKIHGLEEENKRLQKDLKTFHGKCYMYNKNCVVSCIDITVMFHDGHHEV